MSTNIVLDQFSNLVRNIIHHEWDPIGVADYSDEMGEYDGYIPSLLNMLEKGCTQKELFDYLWEIETVSMGLDGDKKMTEKISSRLHSLSSKISMANKKSTLGYLLIDYDPKKKCFISCEGDELGVTLQKEGGYEYYIHGSRDFIVKLYDDWIKTDQAVGELLTPKGKLLDLIPHPGNKYRIFSINGLFSGDSKSFKFNVIPYSNERHYALEYNIAKKNFVFAGYGVR